METAIRKQITLLMNRVTVVNYVQGTDVIPIEFEVMDYPLPSDTEARIYVHKPSKAIIYNFATVSGQKITITPTTQMFAEVGENMANIEVIGRTNGKKLATFPVVFRVAPNFRDEGALESKDEYEVLIRYMKIAMSYAVGDSGIREGEDTDNAKYYRTQSRSWASGGTGERDGEDTDNSLWWKTMSESYAKGATGKRTGEATDNSKYYMTQSHSFAKGETGERDGEDTDNSKYYSEQSAKSAAAAKTSETNAKTSETNAKTSETNAKTSETNAKKSETAAKTSETNAKASETAASKSASAAAASQSAAKTSETNASSSASTASTKASEAAGSASAAKTSETNASSSAKTATDKANAASSSATSAANSATAAANSASAAKTSETNAAASADLAAARAVGALKPVGTIKFSQLPTSGQAIGDMYNISDAFTTTASFEEGAGKAIPAGSNVYWTKNQKWNVLSGVTNVKAIWWSAHESISLYDYLVERFKKADDHFSNKGNPHEVTYEQAGAAPKNHASSSTGYGIGSKKEYGHLRVGDGLDVTNGVISWNEREATDKEMDDIITSLLRKEG